MTTTGLRSVEALLPLGGLVFFLFTTMAVFGVRCATVGRPRTPYIEARGASPLWKWWMEWWVWLWGPFERACIGLGISPNSITVTSTLASFVAAALLGTGHVSLGGWTYLFAASLDLVDGRVARAQGSATTAGAFLDSTLDRVAELAVFAGLAVHFRAAPALYAVLAASGASVLVSYARARGEALGIHEAARVGGMQRAERVVLTGVPCALAPLFDAAFIPGAGGMILGSALALLALLTIVTAARRSFSIWSSLRRPAAHAQRGTATVHWLDAVRWRERLGHGTRRPAR